MMIIKSCVQWNPKELQNCNYWEDTISLFICGSMIWVIQMKVGVLGFADHAGLLSVLGLGHYTKLDNSRVRADCAQGRCG